MSTRYAVIVGVSSYEDDGISNLRYTSNDAIRLARVLKKYPMYDANRIYLITDAEATDVGVIVRRPTRSNILEVIKYVANAANNEEEILVFFAGHGAEISKEPYLLVADTRLSVVSETAIDVRDINQFLQTSKARCVVRLFDACRSGFGDSRAMIGRMTDGLQEAIAYQANGWATLSSCSSGEVAYEASEFEHGVFTNYLCEALEGKAALEDGLVTFERLVDYVKIGVKSWCDRQTVQQTPHLVSDLSGTLILSNIQMDTQKALTKNKKPVSNFLAQLDAQILQTPSDVRNLSFTSPEQYDEFYNQISFSINELVSDFSHKAITIKLEKMPGDNLRTNRGKVSNLFVNDINRAKVSEELQNISSITCSFVSSDVLIPTTTLYIAVIQFSFFYWIWWVHSCSKQQLENRFNPDPVSKNGFITFKPTGVIKQDRVDNAVNEIFEQAFLLILEWSGQLSKYVDSRIDPLRKIDGIIE